MHTNFFLPFSALRKTLQRAITPRELAPTPYFLLCRYILLISMCLQKLMTVHHCVFKILEKKNSVADGHTDGHTDGRTDGRTDRRNTDGQRENSIPPINKVCGDIKTFNSLNSMPFSYYISKQKK